MHLGIYMFNSFFGEGGPYHIGFYMIGTSVMKVLKGFGLMVNTLMHDVPKCLDTL